MVLPEATLERFLSRVDQRPDSEGGCWLWIGGRWNHGYGYFKIGDIMLSAHRLSYELFVATIPAAHVVCHRCDTPLCVNPDHLWTGTQGENIADCVGKGRSTAGERNAGAVLTDRDVRDIRVRRANGEGRKALAGAYGVSGRQITAICKREAWAHVV